MSENTEILLEPPVAGDEADTLVGSLERQRRTFAWKCEGLDAAALGTRLAPSALTVGGLIKHLALVEADYFTLRLLGEDPGPPWNTVDWDAEPDWEWRSAAGHTPEELYALWLTEVTRSRANIRRALADGGPGGLVSYTTRAGESPSLRRLLIDMVEEYARHLGQLDLIRESIDGRVGEDPPEDYRPF
ncbi:DinB family protein [Streptomyces cinnabarinus]|uniref:DinB family protein n=1 Tax=Streptomyces cinnabarinus TaxID=67287 RepID=A0ABY7KL71_9ACTN|nr:DinB family protein [Streptomyces cinnabarinus]WAZ23629.1 DinB family protein [Streptomyces cinnabarinus]